MGVGTTQAGLPAGGRADAACVIITRTAVNTTYATRRVITEADSGVCTPHAGLGVWAWCSCSSTNQFRMWHLLCSLACDRISYEDYFAICSC